MTIFISLRYQGDAIRIEIRDNGLGMDDVMMDRLMRVVRGEIVLPQQGGSTAFYGLINVSARLKPYVMDPTETIHYDSRLGQGTTVMVNLKQLLPDDLEENDPQRR